jgi:chitodextrinase
VTLTVTDGNGLSQSLTQQVTVHAAPTLRFAFAPNAPVVGTSVGFDAAGSSDPEPGTSIVSYSWDFGDGSAGSGSTTSHRYQRPGAYSVTLTAISSLGTSASITKTVAVSDTPPVAVIVVGTAHPLTGQQVRFDGSHSTETTSPIASYRWRFGDGGSGSGARVAHAYRKPGSYRVALTVTDSFGGSATAIATVRVALAGRITGLSLQAAVHGATLVVSVNSGGVVSAGRRSIRVRHRGLVRLQIQLSSAQLQQLNGSGSLTIHLALRFAPRVGPASRKRLTIVFRLPAANGHRVYARLQR